MSAAPGSTSKPRRRTKKDKSKQAVLQHVAAVTAGPSSSSPVVQHSVAGPSHAPRDWLHDASFEEIMEDLSSYASCVRDAGPPGKLTRAMATFVDGSY